MNIEQYTRPVQMNLLGGVRAPENGGSGWYVLAAQTPTHVQGTSCGSIAVRLEARVALHSDGHHKPVAPPLETRCRSEDGYVDKVRVR